MARYGTRRYARAPYGSLAIHDIPVVTLTQPTSGHVFTSGPTIALTWTYAQTQGVPAASFRVLIYDTVAEGNVWYDSGVVPSAATSHTVDLVAAGVPTDRILWVALAVTSTDGVGYTGSATEWFTVDFGGPSAVITEPVNGQILTTPQVSVVWQYADSGFRPETAFLVKLFTAEGAQLYSSGWTPAGTDSLTIPFNLTSGSGYQVQVQVENSDGVISAPAVVSFSSANITVPVDVLDSVGEVFDVAINGVGYMLYADPINTPELTRSRGAVSLDPPRLATSQTPFSEAVERYSFVPSADWVAGAGQRWGSKTNSAPNRFYDSLGVNPFEPYELSLLPETVPQVTVVGDNVQAVVASDHLFVLNGSNTMKSIDDPDGAETTYVVATANPLLDITSDGQYWYATDGSTGIYRASTPADPGAPWSVIQASVIGWAGQRLCAAYTGSGSSTPNVFSTINALGAEETPGGLITLAKGWTISDFTSGSGYIWFSAYNGNRGVVYKWGMDATAPSVALELEIGQRPTAIFWYQGNVFVRAEHPKTATDSKATIWRCIAQSSSLSATGTGNLDPHFVCNIDDGGLDGVGTFGANERRVFYSHANIDGLGNSGMDAIDISTGGYCRWLYSTVGQRAVRSIFEWRGKLFFTVDRAGVFREGDVPVLIGQLKTSIYDLGSATRKMWDAVSIQTQPLPVGGAVVVEYTYDGGGSYVTDPVLSVTSPGQTDAHAEMRQSAQSLGLRFTLVAYGTSPVVKLAQAKVHAFGLADTILKLPIDCADRLNDVRGRPFKDSGPGKGLRRYLALEGLVQAQVNVQDVHYPYSKLVEQFEVLSVEQKSLPAVKQDRHTGTVGLRSVAVLTLRRANS